MSVWHNTKFVLREIMSRQVPPISILDLDTKREISVWIIFLPLSLSFVQQYMPVDDHFEHAKGGVGYTIRSNSSCIPSREGIWMQGNLQTPTNVQLTSETVYIIQRTHSDSSLCRLV